MKSYYCHINHTVCVCVYLFNWQTGDKHFVTQMSNKPRDWSFSWPFWDWDYTNPDNVIPQYIKHRQQCLYLFIQTLLMAKNEIYTVTNGVRVNRVTREQSVSEKRNSNETNVAFQRPAAISLHHMSQLKMIKTETCNRGPTATHTHTQTHTHRGNNE